MDKPIITRIAQGGAMAKGTPQDMRSHNQTNPNSPKSSKGNAAPPNVHGPKNGGQSKMHTPRATTGDTPLDKVRRVNVIGG